MNEEEMKEEEMVRVAIPSIEDDDDNDDKGGVPPPPPSSFPRLLPKGSFTGVGKSMIVPGGPPSQHRLWQQLATSTSVKMGFLKAEATR